MKKLRLFDSLKFVLATVACMFAIMPVHAATLPAGYTELEYIESTGTQYIDTGIKITSNDIIETEFKNASSTVPGALYGVYDVNSSAFYANGTYYAYGAANAVVNTNVAVDTNWHNVIHNFVDGTLKLDNTTVEFAPFSFTNSVNSYLFARYYHGAYGYRFSGYVKKHKITRNGAVIINLIPARRNNDGVVGMYDLADSNPETAFHTNAGTGTFIAGEWQIKIATTKYNEESFAPVKTDLSAAVNAVEYVVSNTMSQAQQIDQIANEKQTRPDEGCMAKYCLLVEDEDGTPHWYPIAGANGVAHNLPNGYTELQYIESTGTQYINTGYIPNSNTRWELDNEYTETPPTQNFYNGLYHSESGYQPVRFDIALGVSGMFLDYGAMNIVNSNTSSFINTRYMYVVDAKNNKWAYNDTTGSFPSYSNMATTTRPLFLFARNDNGGPYRFAKQRTYSSKIYDDDILVRDFIPARRDSDGVLGMYDLADSNPATAFHTNAGTGEFVAGPDM